MGWLQSLLCALGLAACGGGALPPAGPITIVDAMEYLADPNETMRYDFGHYQGSVSYQIDQSHAATTWDYTPFNSFDPTLGDGGEQYAVEGGTVRIEGTRDGGHPRDQYFVGKDCGGTGWILFRTDATYDWHELVARLGDSDDTTQCSTSSKALTRYSRQTVTFPVIGERDTIISEHYTGSSAATGTAMERSFFARGTGRVAWQAFANHAPLVSDLPQRCLDFGWQIVAGLQLVDCRISVNADGSALGQDLWRLGR